MMGSPSSESGRDSDEGPVHKVRITKPFYMGAHEVTNAQYQRFLKESGYDGSRDADSDYLKHFKGNSNTPTAARYPMVWVSWKNAQKFCEWLSNKEKVKYRLPTEAEWEYACRAGTRTGYYSGDGGSDLGKIAWYRTKSGDRTHEVGGKAPNASGLYDMSGNAWEWCQSLYKSYPYRGNDGREDLTDGGVRVLRGGSWGYYAWYSRSATRYRSTPAVTNRNYGFRVVASSPPQE